MTRGFWRMVGGGLAVAAMFAAPAAAQYSDGYNFLKAVKERDGTEATRFLKEPGSTVVNSRDQSTEQSALHIVVARRDELWTKFLLDSGANPNIADRDKVTPLALAVGLSFAEGAELLLKRGARADTVNASGETPLIAAVHRRDLAMVRLLLKNGANADRPDNSGRSARDYARLMGASAGVLAEIERAESERKGKADPGSYGPSM